jgi:hypothetical protein
LIRLAEKYNNKYFTFEDFFETLNQSKTYFKFLI